MTATRNIENAGAEAEPASAPVSIRWDSGLMNGSPVMESAKTIADLKGIFLDEAARCRMNPGQEVYRVRQWSPVPAGYEGGLFWGVTIIQPGKVGDEYFMTHGHLHANRARAEYYAVAAGDGVLMSMDEGRHTWGEEMRPGSLHYISGQYAHRVVNVGLEPLIFWACWCSDAGYDYGTIRDQGFGARVLEHDGHPAIVPCA